MLLRKPTTIQLKPEDDYAEYEEFRNKLDQKKNQTVPLQLFGQQQKKNLITSQTMQISDKFSFSGQLASLPQFSQQRRSIHAMQQEPHDTLLDGGWNPPEQVPINQLFSSFAQISDHQH